MSRDIKEYPATMVGDEKIDTTGCEGDDPKGVRRWLEQQADAYAPYNLNWLLAHADDGVIWGRIDDDGALITSYEAARGDAEALAVCPRLRTVTFQQARLFGENGELLLWRDGDRQFRARVIHDVDDSPPEWTEGFNEPQMLWGTDGRPIGHDFYFWRHGAEGLRHALPFRRGYFSAASREVSTPARLVVRHYLNRKGFARVVASRLVGFKS